MVMSQYEKELIVKSIGKERQREASEAFAIREVLTQVRHQSRASSWRSARIAAGVLLMRAGARVAGHNQRFVLEGE